MASRQRDRRGAGRPEGSTRRFDPVVEQARSAARAALAPTGKDLEALLIKIHRESGENQAKARRNQDEARRELDKRLEGTPVEYNGETVMVTTVTTREILAAFKAESDIVKVEALAQRSYNVHQATFGHSGTAGNTIEDFIAALAQEKQTGGAEPS